MELKSILLFGLFVFFCISIVTADITVRSGNRVATGPANDLATALTKFGIPIPPWLQAIMDSEKTKARNSNAAPCVAETR